MVRLSKSVVTAVVLAIVATIDADPGGIFDKLTFGGMLALEAHSPDWAIALDGIYMGLDQDLPNAEGKVDFDQGVASYFRVPRPVPGITKV